MTMKEFYSYLFSCAYWVSIKDLKETSAPQEYASMFLSIVDLLLFVSITGVVNLLAGQNLLNGGIVILAALILVVVNYYIFLSKGKYKMVVSKFESVGASDYKRKRISTMAITFIIIGLLAITASALNNLQIWN